jgi:hypothetical protein
VRLLASRPNHNWGITLGCLSTTTHSIYSQLISITGGLLPNRNPRELAIPWWQEPSDGSDIVYLGNLLSRKRWGSTLQPLSVEKTDRLANETVDTTKLKIKIWR